LVYVGTASGMTLGDDPVKVTATLSCASTEVQLIPRFYGSSSNVAGTTEFSAVSVTSGTTAVPYARTGATNDTSATLSNISFDGRHNLVPYSENFNAWGKSTSTVAVDVVAAPDGTLTADKFIPNNGAATATVAQALGATLGETYSLSVYAKQADQSKIGIVTNLTGTYRAVIFDLASGSCLNGVDMYCGMSKVTSDGWYRLWAFGAAGLTSFQYQISNNGAGWAGDGTSGVYLWGAQFNVGVRDPTTYVPIAGTVTRASVPLDSAGLDWSETGLVPPVTAAAQPTTMSLGAAGPFTDSNYLSQGSGPDPMDGTGDLWGCASFVPATTSPAQQLVINGLSGTSGYGVYISSGTPAPVFYVTNTTPAAASVASTAVVLNAHNVLCWWKDTQLHLKVNLGTTSNAVFSGTEAPGTAYSMKVGRYEGGGSYFTGKMIGLIQGRGTCPTPPPPFAASCEGWAVYQMKRQFGLIGTRGEEISLTRATTATNEVNGIVWNVPAGVPRVTTQGTLIERASLNAVLNNRTHPKTAEATAALGTGAHVAWHEGTGTMTVAAGTATVTGLSCTAVAPGTLCKFTVTAGGTMVITTSAGTVTKAQIETGSTKTSEIPTAGTSVARNADSVNVATTVMGTLNPFCMEVTATPYGGRAWTTTPAKSIFSTFNGSFLNTVSLREGYLGGGATGSLLGNPATGQSAIVTGALSAGTHRLSVSGSFAGVPTVRVDGATPAFTTSGSPGSISTWSNSRIELGAGGASAEFDGHLRDFKVYRSPGCR